MSQPTP
jgi:hypothetical protein